MRKIFSIGIFAAMLCVAFGGNAEERTNITRIVLDGEHGLNEVWSDGSKINTDSLIIEGKMSKLDFITVWEASYFFKELKGLNLENVVLEDEEIPDNALCRNGIQFNKFINMVQTLPIEYITLPSSLKRIGRWALAMQEFHGFNLPSTVKIIDDYALSNLRNFKADEFVLPADLEEIGQMAFTMAQFKTVVFGPKVRYIGAGAFAFVVKEAIYCQAVVPPVLDRNFTDTDGTKGLGEVFGEKYDVKDIKVYVPKGTAESYRAAEGWNLFAPENIIETDKFPTAGVGELTEEQTPDDNAPKYDLNGHRVENPSAGSIYISSGRKAIAR